MVIVLKRLALAVAAVAGLAALGVLAVVAHELVESLFAVGY